MILSNGLCLLMEMGTGKTLTAIAIAGALFKSSKAKRALIVAPLSILGVWEDEFAKFADYDYTLTILKGDGASKAVMLSQLTGDGLQAAVINYESAWRMEKALLQWAPDLIIADEGHKIKTHSIAASKAMHRLGIRAKYKLLLTGTLITNRAIDVFSQYKFANPSIFGNSFYAFRNRYFDMVGYGNHTPVLKRHMEADLLERLHSIAFRVRKEDCLDLPDALDMPLYVSLEDSAYALYYNLKKQSYAELAKGEVTAANILTKLLRLSQLTGGFLGDDTGEQVHQVSTAKLALLEEILDGCLQDGKKLVVMARFVPELDAICRMLERRQLRYARVSGGVRDRAEQVRMFQEESDVVAFVGQIATAGLGLTLTAASTMVFYSMDYSMSNYEQAKARIHRAGQRNACTYYHLLARGTFDEKVLEALQRKSDLARELVDDYRKGRDPFDP